MFLAFRWASENSAAGENTGATALNSNFPDQYEEDKAALYHELASLRSELRELKMKQDAASPEAVLLPGGTASDDIIHADYFPEDRDYADPLDGKYSADELEQLKLDSEARVEQVLAAMEGQIAVESYDAQWAPGIEDAIIATLQQPMFNRTELIDLSCKSSLCRINVQHAGVDAEQEFLSQFIVSAGFTDTEVFYSREENNDGSVQETYYISRDGQRLATLHQP